MIRTKEMDTLAKIFEYHKVRDISDPMNFPKSDGLFMLWCWRSVNAYSLDDVDGRGFHIEEIIADGDELCIKLTKEPDCKHCGNLSRNHNYQRAGNFCQEEYQPCKMECNQNHKHISLVYEAESEEERIKRYELNK